jgi:hypothetical protein
LSEQRERVETTAVRLYKENKGFYSGSDNNSGAEHGLQIRASGKSI